MNQIIAELLSLADRLDSKGFYKEANLVAKCIRVPRKLVTASFKKASKDYLIANTPEERAKGLSGMDPESTKGMLFVFPESEYATFHNKDCLAPIAIKWINNTEVIGEAYLPAYDGQLVQVSSPARVNMVLEQFAQFKRSYDYGKGPYSDMNKKKKSITEAWIRSCPHGNVMNTTIQGEPAQFCLDCQQIITNKKENRGDWSKAILNNTTDDQYNDIGSNEARPVENY